MDYRLEGLSADTFERLVQALALSALGPSVAVYGPGPDGGRDATYDGPIQGLGSGDWDGRLVIQAKFLQRPKGSKEDGEWALGRLRHELQRYRQADAADRPDYFLFVTNVALTAVPEQGSRDRLHRVLDGAVEDGLFKDYDVWDRDKLCRLIDCDSDIRMAYGAWITPGDVLAQIAEDLRHDVPDLDGVLSLFLQKELLADQYANLEQAGRPPEDRIPIARVFVDLPVESDRATDDGSTGFLSELLEDAHQKLSSDGADGRAAGRWVLVGGPGQGKTTLGQFVCQLFRVAMLKDRPRASLSVEAERVLDSVATTCDELDIALPAVRRFPLRVALKDFASDLEHANGKLSLLKFILGRIERRVDDEIAPEVFRSWLAACPWLIVLDGLDEVPASGNRRAVLSAVDEFWIDTAHSQADVLVLATTRPQGYSEDFSPAVYRHCSLAPLDADQALAYADRLVAARYSSDVDRSERILRGLTGAVEGDATAHLMRSPLQVTIMATLVEQAGSPPEQRWSLFSQYYEVIYNREVERDVPAAWVLRQHKPDVDTIHRRVGLALQLESEINDTAAHMSRADLSALVEQRLVEEQHTGPELLRLRDAVLEAAAERLVFLVGVEEDRAGFEIRSLQEFMAAEALMDGSKDVVADRLRTIARASAWRNALLFAAGRCFADRQYLRDTIHTLCVELNDASGDMFGRMALDGAALATDLLEDGPARDQPMYRRLLLEQALRVTGRPATDAQERLASLYDPRDAEQYGRAVEEALGRDTPRSGVWRLLHQLALRGVDWAAQVMWEAWPEPGAAQVDLIRELGSVAPQLRKSQQVATLQGEVNAHVTRGALNYGINTFRGDKPFFDSLQMWSNPWSRLFGNESNNRDKFIVVPTSLSDFALGLVSSMQPGKSHPKPVDPSFELPDGYVHPAWRLKVAANYFRHDPTRTGLAAAIEKAGPLVAHGDEVPGGIPWPLLACALAAEDEDACQRLASAAREGRLGGPADWATAESRWVQQGIRTMDIEHPTIAGQPFDANIATIGCPCPQPRGRSATWGRESTYSTTGLRARVAQPIGACLGM